MSIILNLAGVIITALFGVWALVQPQQFSKLIALNPYNKRGITEIRAMYGGMMLGLSIYTLVYQSPILFNCLGCAWLSTALVRLIAMFLIDHSSSKTSLKFVLVELVVGVFLLV